MRVSQKEKLMLMVLLAVIILLGGYKFVLTPALTTLDGVSTTYNEAKLKKEEAEDNIASEATMEESNKTLEKKVVELSSAYFPRLQSDTLQVYFNNIAKKTDVKLTSFVLTFEQFGMNVDEFTSTYISGKYYAKDVANQIREINGLKTIDNMYAEEVTDDQAASQSSQSSTQSSQGTETSEENKDDYLDKADVDIQFTCPYSKVSTFVDSINKGGRNAYVTALAMNRVSASSVYVTATVRCYGVVKIDDSDKLSNNTLSAASGKSNPLS